MVGDSFGPAAQNAARSSIAGAALSFKNDGESDIYEQYNKSHGSDVFSEN